MIHQHSAQGKHRVSLYNTLKIVKFPPLGGKSESCKAQVGAKLLCTHSCDSGCSCAVCHHLSWAIRGWVGAFPRESRETWIFRGWFLTQTKCKYPKQKASSCYKRVCKQGPMLPALGEGECFPRDLVHCSEPCHPLTPEMSSLWLLPLGLCADTLFSKQPLLAVLITFPLPPSPKHQGSLLTPQTCPIWDLGGNTLSLPV